MAERVRFHNLLIDFFAQSLSSISLKLGMKEETIWRGKLSGQPEHACCEDKEGGDPHPADRREFQESKAEMFISYSRGCSLFYI